MRHKGFTILEILFALAILVLVVTMITFSFSKLNASQALDKSAVLVASILDEARSLTLSSKGDSQYGVHFESSQVILFKGASYLSSDPSNITTELHPLVGLGNINLSGGSLDVTFKRLTGHTDQAGSVEVFLTASPSDLHIVNISATGISDVDF